ncbi:MAG: ketoacyl-ACP synthase III [Bacteroidetes bacterium]|nr:ketoacyl-ACP synthase III [Bacteroidota bacterium]
MMKKVVRIAGTGSYLPERVVPNEAFLNHRFFQPDGTPVTDDSETIIRKFSKITGIRERRWIEPQHVTSDLGFFAAKRALESVGADPESVDIIICAQNFGDIAEGTNRGDLIPSVASRIKQKLGIRNPFCVAWDINFGCPAWILGLIQARNWLLTEGGTRALVIGVETLSRVSDPHDRDVMIFADGAGAVLLESGDESGSSGLMNHLTRTDTEIHNRLLKMGRSYGPDEPSENLYVKMDGHRLYEYAIETVPESLAALLRKANLQPSDIRMLLIHQANTKMLESITRRLFRQFGDETWPDDFLPLIVSWMGNNAVASVPVLLDRILRGEEPGYSLKKGDKILLAAVGSGMSVSAMIAEL